jgi:hypothetical protein
MKRLLCTKFIFRAGEANLYCTSDANHPGVCTFPSPNREARVVEAHASPAHPQQAGRVVTAAEINTRLKPKRGANG